MGILQIKSLRTGQSFEFGTTNTIPSGCAIRSCMYLSKAGALAKIESEHLDLWGVHLPTLNVAAIYQVKYNLYVPWTQMMTYEKYVGIIR